VSLFLYVKEDITLSHLVGLLCIQYLLFPEFLLGPHILDFCLTVHHQCR